MFYQLPPVGNPVLLDRSKKLKDVSVFTSFQTQYYASGTAALAAAIVAVLALTRNNITGAAQGATQGTTLGNVEKANKKEIPEVIFPAYGCPDLISAAVFAGVRPVLVDLEVDSPWLDLSQLSAAITENTIAIVAVNLCGIAERWSQLRVIADQHDLTLIEDSAQYFPGIDEDSDWQGDLVVLSFGRGKPVSLLGGGAVLIKNQSEKAGSTEAGMTEAELKKNDSLYDFLPKPLPVASTLSGRLLFTLKTTIYNVMISPFLYWLPQVLPFLHLGETRYHPLLGIDAMDQLRLDILASNISRYQYDAESLSRSKKISSMLGSLDEVNNLPLIKDLEVKTRLLRYPLLVDGTSRNRIYGRLKKAGLGVSILYPASLPKIAGLEQILKATEFKNAEAFAARIITLPTHRYVSDKIIEKIKAVLIKHG